MGFGGREKSVKPASIGITRVLIAALSVGCMYGLCAAAEKPALSGLNDRESYSIGYSFGNMTRNQGVGYDLELLLTGVRDAYGGKEPALSQEEMKTVLKELEKKIYVSVQKQYQEQIAKKQKEGEAFLAENSRKEGVITLPSGLQYKIIKEGTGPSPHENDMVSVNYRGNLIDGREFGGTGGKGKPETVAVKGVIPAWTEALKLMKPGATWQLVVPPALGYGQRGLAPRIPPNSVLIFELELVSIEKPSQSARSETAGAPKQADQKKSK
jgi:FKBP-type peptidyl-prolyl cis-trans isomerase